MELNSVDCGSRNVNLSLSMQTNKKKTEFELQKWCEFLLRDLLLPHTNESNCKLLNVLTLNNRAFQSRSDDNLLSVHATPKHAFLSYSMRHKIYSFYITFERPRCSGSSSTIGFEWSREVSFHRSHNIMKATTTAQKRQFRSLKARRFLELFSRNVIKLLHHERR